MKKRRSADAAMDCDKISESDGVTMGAAIVSNSMLGEAVALGGTGTGELGLGGRGGMGKVSDHEPSKSFHANASESGVAWIGETDGITLS